MNTFRRVTIGVGAVAMILTLGQNAPAALVQSINLGTPSKPIYKFTSSDGATATGNWTVPTGVTSIQLLVVGGGGGGGGGGFGNGGGGGAGGLIYRSALAVGTALFLQVGAGGASGANGSNSFFGASIGPNIAIGGGRGGGLNNQNGQLIQASSGGSGGGGGSDDMSMPGNFVGAAAAANIPWGTQGCAGGNGDWMYNLGGGGGGATAAGGVGVVSGDYVYDPMWGQVYVSNSIAGAGGNGFDYSAIFGTSVGDSGWFAGGGGGGGLMQDIAPPGDPGLPPLPTGTNSGGMGGKGGGGAGGGGYSSAYSGVAGTGGGGGGGTSYGPGGSGGSGVVVLSYTVVPEPGTLLLLATGCLGLIAYAWRRRS